MTWTIESLPFDPAFAGRADLLQGVEKVRAFSDPAMRKLVFEVQTRLERTATRRRRARRAWTSFTAASAPKD